MAFTTASAEAPDRNHPNRHGTPPPRTDRTNRRRGIGIPCAGRRADRCRSDEAEPWDKEYAHKPWVIKHEGVVYHFYCAVGKEGRCNALATSKDLRTHR